jgi:hypothetical protein
MVNIERAEGDVKGAERGGCGVTLVWMMAFVLGVSWGFIAMTAVFCGILVSRRL